MNHRHTHRSLAAMNRPGLDRWFTTADDVLNEVFPPEQCEPDTAKPLVPTVDLRTHTRRWGNEI